MLTAILGLLFSFQPQPPRAVHFPTSDAIDVARMAARDLGYPIDRYPKLYFFDVVTAEGGKPLTIGYTAISFWSSAHPMEHFQIKDDTEFIDRSRHRLALVHVLDAEAPS